MLIASIEPFLPFEDLPEPSDNARFRASVPPEDMATVLETFPTSIQQCLCQSLTTWDVNASTTIYTERLFAFRDGEEEEEDGRRTHSSRVSSRLDRSTSDASDGA